jgi:peptidylprolyl isomerase
VCPRTCESFRGICARDYDAPRGRMAGKRLTYEGSAFHRIVPGLGAFGGDVDGRKGLGGTSVFSDDRPLVDENFALRHTGRGVISMVGSGRPDSVGSCFMLQLRRGAIPEFDGRHVVFGFVAQGWEVLDRIEACAGADGFPTASVEVVRTGQVLGDGTAQAGSVLQLRRARAAAGLDVWGSEVDEKGDGGCVGGQGGLRRSPATFGAGVAIVTASSASDRARMRQVRARTAHASMLRSFSSREDSPAGRWGEREMRLTLAMRSLPLSGTAPKAVQDPAVRERLRSVGERDE